MALSAPLVRSGVSDTEASTRSSEVVKDTEVLYDGALVQFDAATGLLHPYGGAGAEKLAGWYFGDTITGDSAGSVEAQILHGPLVFHNIEVAGLADAAADLGADVWATDDGTYTITDPGGGHRVGVVTRRVSATHANVRMREVIGLVGSFDVVPTPTPSPTPTPTPTPT